MGQLQKTHYSCQNLTKINVLHHFSPWKNTCEFHGILTILRWFLKLSLSHTTVVHCNINMYKMLIYYPPPVAYSINSWIWHQLWMAIFLIQRYIVKTELHLNTKSGNVKIVLFLYAGLDDYTTPTINHGADTQCVYLSCLINHICIPYLLITPEYMWHWVICDLRGRVLHQMFGNWIQHAIKNIWFNQIYGFVKMRG